MQKKGTTSQRTEYEFIDTSVKEGTLFEYRLADVDVNALTAPGGGAVIALPLVTSTSSKVRGRAMVDHEAIREDFRSESDVFWALVWPAGRSKSSGEHTGSPSRLYGPGGTVVAETEGPQEAVIHADVPIKQAAESP